LKRTLNCLDGVAELLAVFIFTKGSPMFEPELGSERLRRDKILVKQDYGLWNKLKTLFYGLHTITESNWGLFP
jgi:hypothetical protein